MQASEIMVCPVIAATTGQSVYTVMAAMVANRISGVPVVNSDGELIGIVSEGDLMRRPEAGTRHRHSVWFRILWGPEEEAAEFIKENARKVDDVMTREVVTAEPDTDLADIADLLEKRKLKRIPIVEDRLLVGIITRLDLVRAALTRLQDIAQPPKNDDELRRILVERLKSEPWTSAPRFDLKVHDGEVELWGLVDSPIEKKALRVAVETVPGVRAVHDHLTVRPPVMGV